MKTTACMCQDIGPVDCADALEILAEVRDQCPVLGQLLVPDSTWNRYREFHTGATDDAEHVSVVYGSLISGCLGSLTEPLHRLLLDGSLLKRELTKQYRNDLTESWMFQKDEIERHRKSRIFIGRLAEIHTASWLEDKGWTITQLEAFGGKSDIQGIGPDKRKTYFEVKYIGQEDEEFNRVLSSLRGEGGAAWVSTSNIVGDYVMLRTYEGAKQLEWVSDGGKQMVVVLSGH